MERNKTNSVFAPWQVPDFPGSVRRFGCRLEAEIRWSIAIIDDGDPKIPALAAALAAVTKGPLSIEEIGDIEEVLGAVFCDFVNGRLACQQRGLPTIDRLEAVGRA